MTVAIEPELWRVNGVELAVTAAGEGPLVVLAHGFPDLALTWRLQIPVLVEAGFRVLAPDMRGYGGSSRPRERSAYALRTVGLDLIGLLEHEGADAAHFVGHDWGAACVWQLGLDHPAAVRSLAGFSVPYTAPAPAPPTRILRARWGEQFYQIRFQEAGPAEALLMRDVERALAAIFSDRYDLLDTGTPVCPPGWLPPEMFGRIAAQFRRTGFAGGLNYYRNIDDNWRHTKAAPERVFRQPSLFVTGSEDPVTTFMRSEPGARAFEDLRTVVVEGAGHWVHQQAPDTVNEALLAHLRRAR
ncbi:alpha/beta fold hydrolase [Amycolatopsis sacchari]|uniref:Pimeloyl-ACP methyl ester carboxylesterase n=1 Tax=Amycolatopsis sacchari TaxID=115433 RepID=A0A1I3R6N6_9PSEU|nr:alpha/beta hydrolase [Amycolatopsis sacchari]SFJ41998.1 Pimeloyl-ACP methyl ester carboxylesterase [Amycolatopsis sacchari]